MCRLILILTLTLLIFSCERYQEVNRKFLNEKDGLIYYNGHKFTGKEIEYYYKSDQKKFERHYKNGMLGGKIIKWYENGNKKAEGNYIYHNKNDYYKDDKAGILKFML